MGTDALQLRHVTYVVDVVAAEVFRPGNESIKANLKGASLASFPGFPA